jgi:hypothetical protein
MVLIHVAGEKTAPKQWKIYSWNCQRESSLIEEEGRLVRVTANIAVDVFNPFRTEVLFEAWREKHGKRTTRTLGASFAEKIKGDADPKDEVKRGFLEELPLLAGHVTELRFSGIQEEAGVAYSYPGLATKYKRHCFEAVINEQSYNPEGYITVESDKTTCFLWKPVE